MIIKINTGIPEGKKERTNPSANKPSFLVLAHRQVRQMSDVRSVSTIGNYKGSPDKPGGLSIQLCKSEKKEFYIRYSS